MLINLFETVGNQNFSCSIKQVQKREGIIQLKNNPLESIFRYLKHSLSMQENLTLDNNIYLEFIYRSISISAIVFWVLCLYPGFTQCTIK